MVRRCVICTVLLSGVLVLAACAAGPNDVAAATGATQLAGFWQGLWHGIISPITFLISLFNHNVGMYEVHNSGGWYNFGFLFGVMLVFSGGGAGSRRSTTRSRRMGARS